MIKANGVLTKNCACPGCCYLVSMNERYCSEHVMDARHQRMPHVVHATVGETRFVKYETTVGHPETGRNRI